MLPAPHASFRDDSFSEATVSRRRTHIFHAETINPLMNSRPKRIFGGVSSFLHSRIGCRWSRVLLELSDRLESDDRFRAVLPLVGELVEFFAVQANGRLVHGSGLLQGQPLQAGWRRRLYVCPNSGRLLRIPMESATNSEGY